MERSLSKIVFRNTIFTSLSKFWRMFISLILAPYIIKKIGVEQFGLWAIVMTVVSYAGFLDFGLGTPFVKYIAEYFTKRDYKNTNRVISTGFFSYLVLGAAIFGVGQFFIPKILGFFKLSPRYLPDAIFVLRLALLLYVVETTLWVFPSVIRGLQRMDISNGIQIVTMTVAFGGTFLFLELGYGIRGLIYNDALALIVAVILEIAAARKLLPELRLRFSNFHLKTLKTLMIFGIKLQVSKIGQLIYLQLDKILLSHFIAVSMVTYYQLGSRIAFTVRFLPALLMIPLMPAFSELSVRVSREDVYKNILKTTKYIVFATLPLAFFIVLTASLIFEAWLGPGFEQAATACRILIFGYLSNAMIIGALVMAFQGLGHPGYQSLTSLVTAVACAIFSTLLIIHLGFLGAPLGTCLGMNIGVVVMLITSHKFLKKSIFKFFIVTHWPALKASLIATLPVIVWIVISDHISYVHNRINNLLVLCILAVVFFSTYIIFYIKRRYFSKEDWDTFCYILPYMIRIRNYLSPE